MKPVRLLPEARAEFDEATDWYEQQRPGLGTTFVARIRDTLKVESRPTRRGGTRRSTLMSARCSSRSSHTLCFTVRSRSRSWSSRSSIHREIRPSGNLGPNRRLQQVRCAGG